MNKEIGNVAGVSIMVNPETYEDIKKRKTIYENEILNELQQRIDKEIEYIEEHKEPLHHSFDEPDCNYWIATNPDDLLNILRGEDNAIKSIEMISNYVLVKGE